ncbi:unnamed protein product, partial [Mesorhabditis spiculigera]
MRIRHRRDCNSRYREMDETPISSRPGQIQYADYFSVHYPNPVQLQSIYSFRVGDSSRKMYLTLTILVLNGYQLVLTDNKPFGSPYNDSIEFANASATVYCASNLENIWLSSDQSKLGHAMARVEMWPESPGIDCVCLKGNASPVATSTIKNDGYSLHAGANEPFILSRQLPSVTNMTIGADCETDCRLRIVIGLSCYLPTSSEDDRVPLMINGTFVLADSCTPPELYVHSPFEGVMQSMTNIGSGAVHTFVADALYHVVLFRTIQPSVDTGGYIEGYTGSIDPEGDKTRLVDTFEMDGRTLISPVKWSDRVATLWFVNGTFDLAFKSLHELHNVDSNVSSVAGSGVYDTLYADELSYGHPADNIVDGSFEWTYNNTDLLGRRRDEREDANAFGMASPR